MLTYFHQILSVLDFLKYPIEFLVLLLIFREIRALRKHGRALEQHEKHLEQVRPLYSNLHVGSDEIMNLAIASIREAKELFALGTLNSLTETEMRPDESELAFKERLGKINAKVSDYVMATRENILNGHRYCRIMDFRPIDGTDESIFEISANICFFVRLMEFAGSSQINLEVYHNPEILKGRGDFHFRCSDRRVVLRAGGQGNTYANAAISITDTRVVNEFKNYYDSLIHDRMTKRLELHQLVHLRQLLVDRKIQAIDSYISSMARGAE